jgi:photosynthetic reaction center cytochrome c subunit/tetratricopeptide repeat protein
MSLSVRRVALAAPLVLLLVPAAPGLAQMNEPPKNLKVLPKDMARPEVIKIMRAFSAALGEHCEFCHADPPGPGKFPDFASDDKENKEKARTMMRMVAAINGDFMTKLGEEKPPMVACETCHHGAKEPPEPLANMMTSTATTKGVTAAFNQYSDLKTKYGDAGMYDFRAGTLLRVARALDEGKHGDDALAVLRQSKTMFPQSADVAAALGGALIQAGDVTGGKAELERALSIDPNNIGAKMGLDRLNRPPAAPPKP